SRRPEPGTDTRHRAHVPQPKEIAMLKRAMPLIMAAATVTTVAWAGTAGATDHLPGRFTGGGRFYSSTGVKRTHGFELHCFVDEQPNNLEVNWTGGHSFHLEQMTWASCSDRPNV